MRLSEKLKTFCGFLTAFPKLTLNFEHFETKKSSIAQVFERSFTPKDAFTSMHERS